MKLTIYYYIHSALTHMLYFSCLDGRFKTGTHVAAAVSLEGIPTDFVTSPPWESGCMAGVEKADTQVIVLAEHIPSPVEFGKAICSVNKVGWPASLCWLTWPLKHDEGV